MIAVDELQGLALFESLLPDDLNRIAAVVEKISFDRGEQVVKQGEPGDFFYIILSGQFDVYSQDAAGQRQLLHYLSRGEFFGEQSLLTGQPRNATVEALTDVELIQFDFGAFHGMRRAYPQVAEKMDTIARLRSEFSSKTFPDKGPDEIGIVFARRHAFAFLKSVLAVAVTTVVLGVALALFVAQGLLGMLDIFVIGAVIAVFLTAWVFWLIIDWRNDHFIVTTRRVLHIERVVPLWEQRFEAPIEQVQEVTVRVPSFIANFLSYRDLVIRTGSAAGTILFTSVADAEELRQQIFQARDKAVARHSLEKRQSIRDQLSHHLGMPVAAKPPASSAPKASSGSSSLGSGKWEPWLRILLYFAPLIEQRWGSTIVWRRHPYILIRKTGPALLTVGFLGTMTLLAFFDTVSFAWLWQPVFFLPLLLLDAVSLIWLFWRYEDWHNDYYSLTDSQIIDRNSAPLGFAEVKRIGTFEAIQRIRSDVPNVFNTILNMGNVYVDLTGDQEPIKFLSVYKPHEVQQVISRRLDAFRERKRKDESQRLGQELGDWFAVYHDLVP